MALAEIPDYLKLVPVVKKAPQGYMWASYDEEADTLYINFEQPSHATYSELTDKDVIIRYEGNEVIGLTVLHTRKANLHQSPPAGRVSTRRNSTVEVPFHWFSVKR